MDRPIDEDRPADAAPRAVLRVPDVLMAVAATPGGAHLTELVRALGLPKTSLHRILRALESGGYLQRDGQTYRCGPESARLARLLGSATAPVGFPACARPIMERLATETGETVMLSELSEDGRESVYLDVIESSSPLRFAMRPGNRRPLYSVASGKAMLAFQPAQARVRYLEQTDFIRFTSETATRETLPGMLAEIAVDGVALDCNGIIDGASAIASPVFDGEGRAFAALSVAGPTDRIKRSRQPLSRIAGQAGEEVSRLLGLKGSYPPKPPSVSGRT